MDLGVKIKRLRESRKMSQDQLAGLLGVAQTTVSNIESGRSAPDFLLMNKVCGVFDKTFDYFLEEEITINNTIDKVGGGNVEYYNSDTMNMLPEHVLQRVEARLIKLEEEIKQLKGK